MTTFFPALLAALVLGLVIFILVRRSRPVPTDIPEPGVSSTIHRVRATLRAILGKDFPGTVVSSYGATEIDLREFTITITTVKDSERDEIRNDKLLRERFRQALINADYPAVAIPRVIFEIESQESINRAETRDQGRK